MWGVVHRCDVVGMRRMGGVGGEMAQVPASLTSQRFLHDFLHVPRRFAPAPRTSLRRHDLFVH